MAGLALIAPLISGIASAAGAVMSAQGQADAQEAQANIKDAEAQAQLRQGLEDSAIKQREAQQQERKTKKILSDQRAGFANSGGGIDSGSALQVATDTAERGILNRDATIWEGEEARAGRQSQANILVYEAEQYRKAAQTTRTAGVISGVSGVFGSGGGAFKGSGGSSSGGSYYYDPIKTG